MLSMQNARQKLDSISPLRLDRARSFVCFGAGNALWRGPQLTTYGPIPLWILSGFTVSKRSNSVCRDETKWRVCFCCPVAGQIWRKDKEGMNGVFKHPETPKGDAWTGELYRILACMILNSLMRAWCIFLHFCSGGSCCRSHHWWRIQHHPPADLCHTFPVPELSACTECKTNSDFWKVVGQFRFFFRHCFGWRPLSATRWVFDGPYCILLHWCAGGIYTVKPRIRLKGLFARGRCPAFHTPLILGRGWRVWGQ